MGREQLGQISGQMGQILDRWGRFLDSCCRFLPIFCPLVRLLPLLCADPTHTMPGIPGLSYAQPVAVPLAAMILAIYVDPGST